MMATKTNLVAAAVAMVAFMMPASAFHIDPYPSNAAGLTPGDWAVAAGSVVITCESNGPADDLNDNSVALPGGGGLCSTGEGDSTGLLPNGQGYPFSGQGATAPSAGSWARLDVCDKTVGVRGLNVGDFRYTAVGAFAAGTTVANGDSDEGSATTASPATLRRDITPTGPSTSDYLWADSDASGTVNNGDFRYTATNGGAAGTNVYGGDSDVGNAGTAVGLAVDADSSGTPTFGDYLYNDVDATGTVTSGDFRYTAVGTYTAGSTVSNGDTDIGSTPVYTGIMVVGGATPATTDALYVDNDSSNTVTAGDTRLADGTTVAGPDADVGASLAASPATLRVDEPAAGASTSDVFYADMDGSGTVDGNGYYVPAANDCASAGGSTAAHTFTARLGAFQCDVPTVAAGNVGVTSDYAFWYDRLYAWYSYDTASGDGFYTAGDDSGPHTGDGFSSNVIDNEDAFHGHVTVFISTNAAQNAVGASTTGSVEVASASPPGSVSASSAYGGVTNACGASPAIDGPVFRAPGV